MQVVQIACLVSWQARQYVLQVSVRIMPVHARRLDQAHDSRRSFTTAQRTGEQPVGATVDRQSTIIKLRAAHPPRAGAARRFALPIEPVLNAGWPSLLGQKILSCRYSGRWSENLALELAAADTFGALRLGASSPQHQVAANCLNLRLNPGVVPVTRLNARLKAAWDV